MPDLDLPTFGPGEGATVLGRTAADEVADRIRDLVHRGDLSPGDRLPAERRLCESFGVGRVAVREALAALRAQGYVTVRRGQHGGSFVTALSVPYRDWWLRMRQAPGLLQEVMEHRTAIETYIARLAATRRTKRDLDQLRAAVDATSACETALVFRQADAAFHASLAQAARNDRLHRAMLACRAELFVPANTRMVTFAGMRETHEQHGSVLEAVVSGDPDAAASAMTDHLRHAEQDIQGSLDSHTPMEASP